MSDTVTRPWPPWSSWPAHIKTYPTIPHRDPTRTGFSYKVGDAKGPGRSCVSAGMLFFTQDLLGARFLLSYEHRAMTDIGGKADKGDMSPLQTAMREVAEELNGIVPPQCRVWSAVYVPEAKYLCYIVEVPATWALNTDIFGDQEQGKVGRRNLIWVRNIGA